MSLNLILIQLVSMSCLLMLLQASRFARGWVLLAGANLVFLGVAYLRQPWRAGLVSGCLWALTILIPLLGYGRVYRLVLRENYTQARRLATWLRWLHPLDGMVEYPHLLKGLELGQKGQLEAATELLQRYQTRQSSAQRTVTALLYRMNAQWDDLVQWVKQTPDFTGSEDASVATIYLRALGETGDLQGLLRGVDHFERRFVRGNSSLIGLVRMVALAFAGRTTAVQQLLATSLSLYPEPTRQFWLLTAELAAGDPNAFDKLIALSNRSDAVMQRAIAWRLAHPPMLPVQLTPELQQRLDTLARSAEHDARYGYQIWMHRVKPYATYALIAANLAMFALTLRLGGSDDLETLYHLGALVPEVVLAGEWWRLLAAMFLHAGWLHLIANMMGLFLFGSLVEGSLGRRKFLLCYLASGLGSMLVVTLLPLWLAMPDQITVGASGAIMGMVGTQAAILLKGWRTEKAAIARDRLRLILVIVGLQVVSDLLTPQVSLIGHVSGLVIGCIMGAIVYRVRR
jgi:rhomboid protease GluP